MKIVEAIHKKNDGFFVRDGESTIWLDSPEYIAWERQNPDVFVITRNVFQMNVHPERVWAVIRGGEYIGTCADATLENGNPLAETVVNAFLNARAEFRIPGDGQVFEG